MDVEDKSVWLPSNAVEARKYIDLLKEAISERDSQLRGMAEVVEKSLTNYKELKEILDERTDQLNRVLEMSNGLVDTLDKSLKVK